MPFNGSGVFQRMRSWVADAAAGIKIRADYHDAEDDGFADGISNCIARDGQTIVLQNIPFNSKRITGLADPVNAQDAATKAYVGAPGQMTGLITTAGSSVTINQAGGSQALMVMGAGGANEAFMTFHMPSNYAVNFGLGADANLWFGGFSMGTTKYQLWSTKDFNYTPVNKAGDTIAGALTVNGGITSGTMYLNGTNLATTDSTNYIIRSNGGIYFQRASDAFAWGHIGIDGLVMNYGNITTPGTLTAAGGLISTTTLYSLSGAVVSRQLAGGGNFGFYLQNSSGGDLGGVIYNAVEGGPEMRLPGTNSIVLSPTGSVKLSNGWRCKLGLSGGYVSNASNMSWGAGMSLWVDTTNLGVISTSSDYRIKQDMRPLPGMWDVVKQLNPIRYEHKNFGKLFERDGIERWGFLAHELQDTLLPSAASGSKDEENTIQSPSWPPVVAALTRALQEAMQRIEALEAKGSA